MKRSSIKPINLFASSVILAEIIVIILLISNYGNCFQDFECIRHFTPFVIKTGPNLSWHDIINSFNAWGLDGNSRSRFLSYFSYILIIKTRLLLWNFLPPHPSASIIWPLTLVLAPFLLYKFLRRILNESTAALFGTAIYLSSCGYLFNATMIFHPGKPLLNVAVITLLFFLPHCREETSSTSTRDTNPPLSKKIIRYVLPLLLASLLLDEMGIFCFVILPIWHPEFFLDVTS